MELKKSKKYLKRALRYIPLASQTFSKSYHQFPDEFPFFAESGNGGRITDVDNNEYIDLIMGLLPLTLGYNDKDVNKAIINQLDKGITFSLPTALEYELSYKLTKLIPSAEKVRFAKNGTDVTSGAIRLARGITKKDKIITCGYHGWQDWYIGSTSRNLGVPKKVRNLSIATKFNDIEDVYKIIKKNKDDIAAMIIEPMSFVEPKKDYYKELQALLKKNKILFIFDEIITGFRFSEGGAQKYFNITPDLSCFGKGMANGMPLSALVGKSKYMNKMSEIFFSGTFGGESLSLAASIATIDKIKKKNVIKKLWFTGSQILKHINLEIKNFKLESLIDVKGKEPWSLVNFKSSKKLNKFQLKYIFMKNMAANGVLTLGTNNICYAHSRKDINIVKKAYSNTFNLINEIMYHNRKYNYRSIKPIFSVRKNA
jgi:glutamate-1-semialdehyde 2,1-aminomutase